MKKEFEINAINYALYEARFAKKVTLKAAAKELGISKLHLNLVEKGYLHVSKKLQPRFIKYYRLKSNFFDVNTTYVKPVYVKYEDPEVEKKIRERMKKKRTKIITGAISLLLLGALGTGLYYFNRSRINPRSEWSKEFTTFREDFIKSAREKGQEQISIDYPGDVEYYLCNDVLGEECKIFLPGQDQHASGMHIEYRRNHATLQNFVYNNKKIGYAEISTKKNNNITAIWTYTSFSKRDYNLPKVTLEEDGEISYYYPGSEFYQDIYDGIFNDDNGCFTECVKATNEILNALSSSITSSDALLNNVQKISTYEVFGFRLGFRLILFPAILLAITLSMFTYAVVKGRKLKPKKIKVKPYVVHKTEYTADAALVYRSVPNDSKFPSIIPECVLRILALAILLLASIGTVWVTQDVLIGQESMKSSIFNAYVSNLLVAGITLAFFLKLDVYHKKSNKELLSNILTLFVFGLVFYVAECVTYGCLSSQGTIYSTLIQLLSGLLPGNIIWNIMLYSLIFLFLFTIPKNIEDAPHKVLLWRLASAFPTLLLLAAFIYKGTFQGNVSPYVSFLFHTNGLLSTAFAIFYLYSLFFFQQYMQLKYGKEFTRIYLDSRSYALKKNIIACVVILALTLIDLAFHFYLPMNSLNLGNNWIIAILIPFILFYRPHIGKRAPKWDLAYTVMYVLFLTGGFMIAFNMIASTLDLSQIQQIMS